MIITLEAQAAVNMYTYMYIMSSIKKPHGYWHYMKEAVNGGNLHTINKGGEFVLTR